MREFARRLHLEMQKRQWSQSDLARAAFGSRKDRRGYNVAKGRDRISVYLRGKQRPEPKHLASIAAALSMKPEELAPGLHVTGINQVHPAVRMYSVEGQIDMSHLVVDMVMPMAVAAKIVSILAEYREGSN
jgi:transcriptional regulator with XRE-family HTH domain